MKAAKFAEPVNREVELFLTSHSFIVITAETNVMVSNPTLHDIKVHITAISMFSTKQEWRPQLPVLQMTMKVSVQSKQAHEK